MLSFGGNGSRYLGWGGCRFHLGAEKLEARKMFERSRRLPRVRCMLCQAACVGTRSSCHNPRTVRPKEVNIRANEDGNEKPWIDECKNGRQTVACGSTTVIAHGVNPGLCAAQRGRHPRRSPRSGLRARQRRRRAARRVHAVLGCAPILIALSCRPEPMCILHQCILTKSASPEFAQRTSCRIVARYRC